jgi:hypothetical protein
MPEALEIPVRLDHKPAVEGLGSLGASLTKTAGEAAELAEGMGLIEGVKKGFEIVSEVVDAMGESVNKAAEFVAKCAEEFISVQKSMQGIAALSGQQNSNTFAGDEIKKARDANVGTKDFVAFREAFLEKSKINIGAGADKKMTDEGAAKFQAAMVEYGALNKVGAAEMAEFSGTLLNAQKGATTPEEMIAKAGKVFATLRSSGKGVGGQVSSLNRLMAQGMDAEDAAPALAQMPGLNVGRNDAQSLMSTFSDIHKMEIDKKKEGKAGQFGITDGMSDLQKLETVVSSLSQRSGGGADAKKLNEMLDEITPDKVGQRVLRGLVGKGEGYSQKFKDVYGATSDDDVQEGIKAGRESDAGKVMHTEAGLEAGRDIAGIQGTFGEDMKKRAETELITSGSRSQSHRLEDGLRNIASMGAGGAGVKDFDIQRRNELAVRMAEDEAGVKHGGGFGSVAPGTSQGQVDKMLQHLGEIAEHTRAAAKAPPLTARQPALGAAAGRF